MLAKAISLLAAARFTAKLERKQGNLRKVADDVASPTVLSLGFDSVSPGAITPLLPALNLPLVALSPL